jgi:aminopeptidase N
MKPSALFSAARLPQLLRAWLGVMGYLLAVSAWGQKPFNFDETPGRLPKEVVPKHYAVFLNPSIEAATFEGSVEITVEARKAVREIVLNSLGLQITESTLDGNAITAKADDATQLLTLTGLDAAVGEHKLKLAFKGKLNERPEGLYLTRYQLPDGTMRKALATQMEATDCRRMFPCWDEPVFRATFQLSALIPRTQKAVSNMELDGLIRTSDGPLTGGEPKVRVNFKTTPAMSSYLVAFACAEFESIEDEVAGVKLRILATPGKKAQMRLAMEATKKVVQYYNEYFGVKYPLEKLDQVAFPGVGAGGMENWGCIIYADTALLHDEKFGSQGSRERVFGIVAHEIAHQWFGDLVTMAWWDNLWLNEGFASWMATKASDHFNPTWKVWLRAAGGREAAMRLDARATTHPIQQPVKTEGDAMHIFDEITYQKGQSFLRMLENWLGEEKFRDGLRLYFKRHAYGNTTTTDLWNALGEASKMDVAGMAAGWTMQPGFPVVTAALAAPGTPEGWNLRIEQQRFSINQTNAAPLDWVVPVAVRNPATAATKVLMLGTGGARGPEEQFLVNANAVGYYRVAYDTALWARLKPLLPKLEETERLCILQDTWALVQAGKLPLTRWLEVAALLRDDLSPTIAGHFLEVIGTLDHLARGDERRGALRAWAREFLAPRWKALGWEVKAGEEPATAYLRGGLIRMLGEFGDAAIVAEAQARAAKYLADESSLPGDLRDAVLYLAGRQADAALWERLHEFGKKAIDTDAKSQIYGALAAARDPALAERALGLSLAGELPSKLASRLVGRIAGEGEQVELAWKFVQAKLPDLLAICAANDADDFVPRLFRNFSEVARAEELEAFTKGNFPPSAARPTAIAADEIRFKAAFKARVLPEFAAWVKGR